MQGFNSLCIIRAVRNPKKTRKMDKSRFYAMGLLALTSLSFATSCDSSDDSETPEPATGTKIAPMDQTTINALKASQERTFQLFSEVDAITEKDKTFTISPLSLAEMLAVVSNGAKGETLKQINSIIKSGDATEEEVNERYMSLNEYLEKVDDMTTFATANSVWIDEDFNVKPEFLKKKLVGETFNQELSTEKTKNDINGWCDKNTRGCIKKILDEPLPSSYRMMVINALYFKGMWRHKFQKDNTIDEDFTNSNGSKTKVKMMHQTSNFLAYAGDYMDMVELPYGNDSYCMDVILPHEGKKLDDCLKGFNAKTFDKYINNTRARLVSVGMPRMKLEGQTILTSPLMAMGMTDAFSEMRADFSGISDERTVLSDVIQITYVNVDEEGTEAAAVTYTGFTSTSLTPEQVPMPFIMNRPFAYIIREKTTGTILFIGKVRKL